MTTDLARWAARFVASSPRRAAEHGRRYPAELAAAVEVALDQAERCRVCGRRLKDPVSIGRKIGRDCLERIATTEENR